MLGGSTAELAPVGVAGCDGKANQLWRPRKEGRFTITSLPGDAQVGRFSLDPGGSGIAYALISGAGVFRSEDGGESWSPLAESLGIIPFDLTVSPVDPDVVYVPGSSSEDGGKSWQTTVRVPGGTHTLAPSTRVATEVFGLSRRGEIFLSRDTARSWTKLGRLPQRRFVRAGLVAHPAQPQTLFASILKDCANNCNQAVATFRSTDEGRRWQAVSAGAPFFFYDLAFDPVDPRHVYAASTAGLLHSADGGVGWSNVDPPPGTVLSLVDLLVDPSRPTRLMALCGQRIFTSQNRGASWSATGFRLSTDTTFILWGASPDGDRVFASLTDFSSGPEARPSGLYVSTDWGKSWNRLGRALSAASVQSVKTTGIPGDRIYAAGDAGLYTTADGGTSWRRLLSGERSALAVDPLDSDHLLASDGQRRIVRSADGGKSFAARARGIDATFVSSLIFLPGAPGTAFALASSDRAGNLYRTRNDGSRWQPVRAVPVSTSLLATDADGGRVYVGTDTSLEISADGGDTWQSQPLSVQGLATDRTRPGEVWVSTPEGLMLSEDRGANWRLIPPPNPNLPYAALTVTSLDAAFGDVVVAFHLHGVWRSSDRGASWTRLDPVFWSASRNPFATVDGHEPGKVWLAGLGLGVLIGDFED